MRMRVWVGTLQRDAQEDEAKACIVWYGMVQVESLEVWYGIVYMVLVYGRVNLRYDMVSYTRLCRLEVWYGMVW